jgi:hypothetical protein
MFKTIPVIAAAAFAAAAFVAFPSLSLRVEAGARMPVVKTDRLDTRPLDVGCSQQAWPYLERGCLRDARAEKGEAREVRLVSIERPAAGNPAPVTR